jgi:hypothetical protein
MNTDASDHQFHKKTMSIHRGECARQAFAGTGACVQSIMKGTHLVFEKRCSFFVTSVLAGVGQKDLWASSKLKSSTHLHRS